MLEVENEFMGYVDPYRQYGDQVLLKLDHSLRVRDLCVDIAASEGFDGEDVGLASACGLLHDIGRFEQWRRFETFKDSVSADHGDLGAQVLREGDLLCALSDSDAATVIDVVEHHNKFNLPDSMSDRDKRFSRVVRDADKLDILFLFTTGEIVKKTHGSAFSDAIFQCLMGSKGVRSSDIETKADRTAVYLAFIFGLNHRRSFEIVLERGYVDRIVDMQQADAENAELIGQLEDVRNHLNGYLRRRAG